jgi:hypothetical protein
VLERFAGFTAVRAVPKAGRTPNPRTPHQRRCSATSSTAQRNRAAIRSAGRTTTCCSTQQAHHARRLKLARDYRRSARIHGRIAGRFAAVLDSCGNFGYRGKTSLKRPIRQVFAGLANRRDFVGVSVAGFRGTGAVRKQRGRKGSNGIRRTRQREARRLPTDSTVSELSARIDATAPERPGATRNRLVYVFHRRDKIGVSGVHGCRNWLRDGQIGVVKFDRG